MPSAIEHTLQSPESKTLEFKRDLSSPRNFLKTLVAFANTAGGRLVFGVDDQKNVKVFPLTSCPCQACPLTTWIWARPGRCLGRTGLWVRTSC